MSKKDMVSENRLIAHYPFNNEEKVGEDISGNHMDAIACGSRAPEVEMVCGRKAARFRGGEYGVSYMELPENLLRQVGDENGLTVSVWVCGDNSVNVWERIFDFGKSSMGPYVFLNRYLRGVCFAGSDLAADGGKPCPVNQWQHVVMTIAGTKGGSLSSAGPRVYLNGELIADGYISQTSSGNYKAYRNWWETFRDGGNYVQNYIGHSQFMADVDFCGAMADFRVYQGALEEDAILGLLCQALDEKQIIELARDKFLREPEKIICGDIELVSGLMEGRVQVEWTCDHPEVIDNTGKVKAVRKPVGVTLTARLCCGEVTEEKIFRATVLPKKTAPYEITIYGDRSLIDISETLYGLFYEDINNAADGGIYGEMIQNRSFENFHFDTYNYRSGENGKSTGRIHHPLEFWFGDTEKVTVKHSGGLGEYLGVKDPDVNRYYIEAFDQTILINKGFCDRNHSCSMNIKEGVRYTFSVWAKTVGEENGALEVTLQDGEGRKAAEVVTVDVKSKEWTKYSVDLVADKNAMGQLQIKFLGELAADMFSLMPGDLWGAAKERASKTAHKNYKANPNYRHRRDLVEALVELHPKFLRFPGGCISEGSYIWDNVYDWKDSVGPVEVRKENFNVWGYNMTMGLGYMEYFQLAEDLHAEPLPVMACGVLCQARSDYANPAGGDLQKKYIKNFTDLIDFAISTDFKHNPWAALRKDMGHKEPFGLHYLGVGNENWGEEFFASFAEFKTVIDRYMKKNYPGYPLTIISTAGAQADDTSYQKGWKYLAGYEKPGASVAFTDGEKSWSEDVRWYAHNRHYMDTIVDEHYYRSNGYLLENADRYDYYYRAYKNGVLDEARTSKVFVGEYASTDKNTLAGAVAEAAVMTGFEKNSDVVRLAATAPLFNKTVTDGTYRWTPDAIWFNNKTMWRTPNYYVQQMFAKYIGTRLLETGYETYENGRKVQMAPRGGVVISGDKGTEFIELKVLSNKGKKVLFEKNFKAGSSNKENSTGAGEWNLCYFEQGNRTGYYLDAPQWKDYQVQVLARKGADEAGIYVGVGLRELTSKKPNMLEYCVGTPEGTGLKVYKDGKEAYTMGDYSTSVFAGNLRGCYDEVAEGNKEYSITVNYGGKDGAHVECYYSSPDKAGEKKAPLSCKLEVYNRDVFHSVTEDEKKIYAKFVNADDFAKKLVVKTENCKINRQAEIITLTGEKEYVSMPNVNTAEEEIIRPLKSRRTVRSTEEGRGELELLLPANAVAVMVLGKKNKA